MEALINFDKENIAEPNLKAIVPYLTNKEFDPNFIRSKSIAAAGIIILNTVARILPLENGLQSSYVDGGSILQYPFIFTVCS